MMTVASVKGELWSVSQRRVNGFAAKPVVGDQACHCTMRGDLKRLERGEEVRFEEGVAGAGLQVAFDGFGYTSALDG